MKCFLASTSKSTRKVKWIFTSHHARGTNAMSKQYCLSIFCFITHCPEICLSLFMYISFNQCLQTRGRKTSNLVKNDNMYFLSNCRNENTVVLKGPCYQDNVIRCNLPTDASTVAPTAAPTVAPSKNPTEAPTRIPSTTPTSNLTQVHTDKPSKKKKSTKSKKTKSSKSKSSRF